MIFYCKNLENEKIAGWISIRTIDRELRAWSGNFSCELHGYVSAGGKVKLGYEREGELTLYEAIPTSQLHNSIVLISYVVSCSAFRSS